MAGAWLLGACAATGGSLLAVSLIGKGMAAGFPAQSAADVTAPASVTGATAGTRAPVSPTSSAVAAARPVPPRPASTSARPRRASPSSPPRPQTASPGTSTPDGTVLTSQGGEVVASCGAAGAYLMSLSPQQGYAVSAENRGPAATAQVTFQSGTDTVTMVITCTAGVPTATTQIRQPDE
jgi:hypothetical protein